MTVETADKDFPSACPMKASHVKLFRSATALRFFPEAWLCEELHHVQTHLELALLARVVQPHVLNHRLICWPKISTNAVAVAALLARPLSRRS
jgi:hypothetical protein